MNIFNIERTFKLKAERNWQTIYFAIDAHGTLIKPTYNEVIDFYPDAIEVMKWLNARADIVTILWTASYPAEIAKFLEESFKQGIKFDFVNSNPLEQNSRLGCFTRKFYANVILDDKGSFDGECDWTLIAKVLENVTGDKILECNEEQRLRLNKGISEKINDLNSLIIL